MKKLTLVIAIVMSMCTFAMANNTDIEDKGYIGIGYSYFEDNEEWGALSGEATANGVTLITGTNINDVFDLEVRYNRTLGDISYEISGGDKWDGSGDASNIGIYIKPKIEIDTFTLYGLVGYGIVTVDNDFVDDSENGLQWGLGGSLSVSDNYDIFVDYVSLYNDDGGFGTPSDYNIDIEAFTFGIVYKF